MYSSLLSGHEAPQYTRSYRRTSGGKHEQFPERKSKNYLSVSFLFFLYRKDAARATKTTIKNQPTEVAGLYKDKNASQNHRLQL